MGLGVHQQAQSATLAAYPTCKTNRRSIHSQPCCVLLSLAIVGLFVGAVQANKSLHDPALGKSVAHELIKFEEPLAL